MPIAPKNKNNRIMKLMFLILVWYSSILGGGTTTTVAFRPPVATTTTTSRTRRPIPRQGQHHQTQHHVLKSPLDKTDSTDPTITNNKQQQEQQDSKPQQQQQQQPEKKYIEMAYEDYLDGTRPDASWNLARHNFMRQGKTILTQLAETMGLQERDPLKPPACLQLTLSNEAVKETERKRIERGGGVDAHPVSLALYDLGCALLDTLFEERPIPRFWFLEIIARIPYFSYVSMLHLYESFGWWRAVELRKVHAAEEWNELHHLLIMESLGGNALWTDRFLGYHVAFFYYWALIAVFLCSPRIAYEFMELLEAHAVDTYGTFCVQNRDQLRQLPPPQVAKYYYQTGDLYLFDDFQVSRTPGSRRPPCDTLLDVFDNICTDEGEHVKTMQACQDYAEGGSAVVSPHHHQPYSTTTRSTSTTSSTSSASTSTGDDQKQQQEDQKQKRKLWKKWSEMVNTNDDNNNNNNKKDDDDEE